MRQVRIPELILRTIEQLKHIPYPSSHPEAVIWRDNDGRLCAYGYSLDGEHWLHFPNLASFRFYRLNDPITAFVAPMAPTVLIHDAYFRNVLPMVLQTEGIEVLHASAVRYAGGVVALCAKSGTGKSTLAYGLQQRRWPLWADDAVVFETDGRVVNTISLPFEIRLHPQVRNFFGLPHSARQSNADVNREDYNFFTQPRKAAPLAAVMELERVTESENQQKVEVLRLSPSKAFPLLLAQAYCFSLNNLPKKRRMLVNYSRLAATTPVFKVRFRPGLENLPLILEAIEKSISQLRCGDVWDSDLNHLDLDVDQIRD